MKQIITILLIFALISSNFAFKIKLNQQIINSQVKTHPIDEILYTTKVDLNDQGDSVNAVLDINSSSTWIIDNTCNNCRELDIPTDNAANQSVNVTGTGNQLLYAFGGQIMFISNQDKKTYQTGTTDLYLHSIGGQKTYLPKTKVWVPFQIGSPETKTMEENQECQQCSKSSLLQVAQLGLGLGPLQPKYSPLFKHINEQTKLEENKLSIYHKGDYMEAQFGQTEDFFKIGNWNVMNNARKNFPEEFSIQTSFSLLCNQIYINTQTLGLKSISPNSKQDQAQFAVFSSTSKYIYFGKANILQKIVDQINIDSGAKCQLQQKDFIYLCDINVSKKDFPVLKWEFKQEDIYGKQSYHQMQIHPENYLESIQYGGVDRYILLLRPGKYELQQSSTYNVASPIIWFGYPIFKEYYMSFDYEKDTIAFANRYEVQMEDQNKIGFFWIILGILGLLAALAALLYIIKEVPYNGYDAHHAIFREKLEKSNQRQRFLTQSQQQFQQSQFNLQPYSQQQMAYNSQFYQPDTNQTIFLPTQQIVVNQDLKKQSTPLKQRVMVQHSHDQNINQQQLNQDQNQNDYYQQEYIQYDPNAIKINPYGHQNQGYKQE